MTESEQPVYIDRQRMDKALAGPFYVLPTGLSSEQLREVMDLIGRAVRDSEAVGYRKGLEDAAELAWPSAPQVKTWSEAETQSLVAAHNRAEAKGKGWYESIYAVAAAARRDAASAIRAMKWE